MDRPQNARAEGSLISVVTSVYNGGSYLLPSLESVLSQTGVNLELIIVDDGSTDGSSLLLEQIARRDSRVCLIQQENQGLTRALISGCGAARGEFIARHDADDLSLPGRLARQQRLLLSRPSLGLVSCWSRAIGPADETLYEIVRNQDEFAVTGRLFEQGEGPPGHGTVMFRAQTYRRVGGYRADFRYAQDWDLWLRLAEAGGVAYVPEFLYAFRVTERSISASCRSRQLSLVELANNCRRARLRAESEEGFLRKASAISSQLETNPRSTGAYFIGKCLLDRRDPRARLYLRRSIGLNPWDLRSWLALASTYLLCSGRRKSVAGLLG